MPLRQIIGPHGERGRWLMEQVNFDGPECLTWPYGRDMQGYGQVTWSGKVRRAARVMCELVNGPPPTPEHHAAHSCGNGHKACIHPKHLRWATPSENQAESVAHGRGKKKGLPRRKLTPEQVAQIKALKGRLTQRQIAAKFGVRFETIGQIHRGRAWPDRPKRHGFRTTPKQRAELIQRAAELHRAGKNYYQIADEIGVSRVTVRRYVEAA